MPDFADNLPGILGLSLFGQPLYTAQSPSILQKNTKNINCRVNIIDYTKIQQSRRIDISGRARIALKQII